MNWLPPTGTLTWARNQACNLSMCPGPELNPGPFSRRADALTPGPNQLGLIVLFLEPSHVFPWTLNTGPSLSFKILKILIPASHSRPRGWWRVGECLTSHSSFLINLNFARVTCHTVSPPGWPVVFKTTISF